MLDFFLQIFSDNPALAVVLVAMCPSLESKVSIPLGLSVQIWGEATLSPFLSFLLSFLGSLLPGIIIILVVKFIKKRTSGFVCNTLLDKFIKRYDGQFKKLSEKSSTLKKCALLATFVAVPLPLTGVYTGSLIAGLTKLKFWQGFASIAVGELVSCAIVLLLSTIIENSAFYVLLISLALIFGYVLFSIVLSLTKKKRDD